MNIKLHCLRVSCERGIVDAFGTVFVKSPLDFDPQNLGIQFRKSKPSYESPKKNGITYYDLLHKEGLNIRGNHDQ